MLPLSPGFELRDVLFDCDHAHPERGCVEYDLSKEFSHIYGATRDLGEL